MQNPKNEVTNYLVPQGTTHLMMWIGSGLPTERIVEYNEECGDYIYEDRSKRDNKLRVTTVNYVETLSGECKKMKEKGESCILVYDSKMVNKEGEEELKKIVRKIPNCYLVDYEDFAKKLKEDKDVKQNETMTSFIDHINEIIEYNKEYPNFDREINNIHNIGNLVDCMRMLLLLCPGKLKEIANQTNKKEQKLQDKDCSMLYHDLDMLQQEDNYSNKNKKTFKINDQQADLRFSKPMAGDTGKNFENGIIFANSPNNQNNSIMQIINNYLDQLKSNEKRGLYNDIRDWTVSINNFSEQYKNEAHRSWYKGRNRTKSTMIEFDGNYSSIPESKFIAIINWFCENMEDGKSTKLGRGNEITFGNDEEKITFVDKKGKTTNVSLGKFLTNLMNDDQGNDIMKKIYYSVRDNKNLFRDPLGALIYSNPKLQRFKIACQICLRRPIARDNYHKLFGFEEYRKELAKEKAAIMKDEKVSMKNNTKIDKSFWCCCSANERKNVKTRNVNLSELNKNYPYHKGGMY